MQVRCGMNSLKTSIWQERIFWLILAALFSVSAAGFYLPGPKNSTLEEKAFWIEKTHGSSRYDIVFAGDSRVGRGISPAHMEEILPGTRIVNLGYLANGFDEPYFELIENRLASESKIKMIVLGITPRMLLEESARNEQIRQELSRSALEVFEFLYFKNLAYAFSSRVPGRGITVAVGEKADPGFHQEFYPNGWIATWRDNLGQNQLGQYKDIFSKEKVSLRLEKKLLQEVNDWALKGYIVVGLRFPSSIQMRGLEDKLSGFDEYGFAQKFQGVGGIWLDIPRDHPYMIYDLTYDGEHIRKDAAIGVSTDLANTLKIIVQSRLRPAASDGKDLFLQ